MREHMEDNADMRFPKTSHARIHEQLMEVNQRLNKCMLAAGALLYDEAKQCM